MVVVSGSWVKNVAPYPTPDINEMVIPTDPSNMSAKAILICHPNSHPFQDRTLALEPGKPTKVGRSVARAKATLTNAIFDCKVLSRHHALLWFDKGKFFLQDTKSSNGTFVNNNKLVPDVEHYEIRSGDIVQFGVDVVENNRKVTHGCIIATLRLYLPDGKEVKPTRSEVAPLDELYKLNQIIQEATQREQCLETKLTALQHLVDETRVSANESWQAYVGEERLLSRVAALENQLIQANQKLGEDKSREEIVKLQEENTSYQKAAKEALEKLHAERLDALAVANEQERARISAQQEVLLAKEQLIQAQQEVDEIAKKYVEIQKKLEETNESLKEREHELLTNLSETKELQQQKLKMCQLLGENLFSSVEGIQKPYVDYDSDLEAKECLISENEKADSEINGVEPEQNHINLTVSPVRKLGENETGDADLNFDSTETLNSDESAWTCFSAPSEASLESQNTISNENEQDDNKHVAFKLPADEQNKENENVQQKIDSPVLEDKDKEKQDNDESDSIDSKTLKYHFQSVQNELKKKIEVLEIIASSNKSKIIELEKELSAEREVSSERSEENARLKEELLVLEQKLKESHNEGVQLRNKVEMLTSNMERVVHSTVQSGKSNDEESHKESKSTEQIISNSVISYEQLVSLEEELVLLKERYAQLSEEKRKLQHDLALANEQYNRICNRSYNMLFVYIAPLILIIIYLLSSSVRSRATNPEIDKETNVTSN